MEYGQCTLFITHKSIIATYVLTFCNDNNISSYPHSLVQMVQFTIFFSSSMLTFLYTKIAVYYNFMPIIANYLQLFTNDSNI